MGPFARIGRLFFAGVGAIALLVGLSVGNPKPLPAQPGADPLLREDWRADEAELARGLAAGISERVEQPRDSFRIADSAGRPFDLDENGRLSFDPWEGGWRPVVPATADAPLYPAEAESLYAAGLKDEALLLYKALRAMVRETPRPPAALRAAAAVATRRINRMAARDSAFGRADNATDPFVFFQSPAGEADEPGATYIISEKYNWRIILSGAWRFKRSPAAVHLKQGDFYWTMASDFSLAAARRTSLRDYMLYRDRLRGLSRQRKALLSYRRAELELDQDCPAAVRCGAFASELRDRRGPYYFREVYFLGRQGGLYLELRLPPGGEAQADQLLRETLASIRLPSDL